VLPLVLGVGNPLRGDDGVAHAVLRRLERRGGFAARVEAAHQLTPEMAPLVAESAAVLFVDASTTLPPGEVRIEAVSAGDGAQPLTHHLSPDTLLLLAERLYGRAPRAWLLTIGAASMELGEGLTPAIEAAAEEAAGHVLSWLRRGDSACTPGSREHP
jgi:hydrogenase maturation protease